MKLSFGHENRKIFKDENQFQSQKWAKKGNKERFFKFLWAENTKISKKIECFRPKSLEFIEPKRQIFKKSQKANNQNRVLEPKEQIKQKILKLGQESLIPKGIKKKSYSQGILWNLIPLGIKKILFPRE